VGLEMLADVHQSSKTDSDLWTR